MMIEVYEENLSLYFLIDALQILTILPHQKNLRWPADVRVDQLQHHSALLT
jgi:hypothetical protein